MAAAMASPSPVPPAGSRRPPEPVEHLRQVIGRMPGPWSSTTSGRLPVAPHGTATRPGVRAVAHGVVHEDGDQLPEPDRVPATITGSGSTWIGHRVGRGRPSRGGRRGGDVAQLHRLERQVQRTGVGAGEQQQVLDQPVMWPTSASMSSRALPTSLTGWCRMEPQVLHAGTHDGQRRTQLMARVGSELALSLQCRRPACERLTDGHQRATRIERTHDDPRTTPRPAHKEHNRCRAALLRGAVLDHLDHVRVPSAPELELPRPGRAGPPGTPPTPTSARPARCPCRGDAAFGARRGLVTASGLKPDVIAARNAKVPPPRPPKENSSEAAVGRPLAPRTAP